MVGRSLLAALLGAALFWGGPAAAAEPTLLSIVTTVCAGHPFDHPGAAAAAKAGGFVDAHSAEPRALQERLGAGSRVLERDVSGKLATVSLYDGQDPARPEEDIPVSDVSICMVTIHGGDPAGLAAVAAWVGTPVSLEAGDFKVYGYRDGPGGRTDAPDRNPALVKPALDSGEHRLLVLTGTDKLAVVALQSGRTAKP